MIIPHHGAVLLDLINKTVQVALMTGAVPTAAITRDVFQDITDLRGQGIDRLELAGLALQKAGAHQSKPSPPGYPVGQRV